MKLTDDVTEGGQGRSPREVESAGMTFAICLVLAAVIVAIAVMVGR